MTPDVIYGWHFVGATLRDGRPVPPDGEWLDHDGPAMPCVSGLHASEHPFDSLQYAPGPILCRVELRGDLSPHGDPVDQWGGRRRRILARRDATAMLRRFAADQALGVAHLWDMPDVVRQYLTTPDESLRDAAWGEAALAAAWGEAARAAAWTAARGEARAAARREFAARVEALFRGEP